MSFPGHFEPLSRPFSHPGTLRRPSSLPVDYDEDIPNNRGIYHRAVNARNTRGSEDSIEVLNLEDFATLRRPTADSQSPYPPFPHTSHVNPLAASTPEFFGASQQLHDYPTSPNSPLPESTRSLSAVSHSFPAGIRPASASSPVSAASRPVSAASRTSHDTFATVPSLVSGPSSYTSHSTYDPYLTHPVFDDQFQHTPGLDIFSPSAPAIAPPPRTLSTSFGKGGWHPSTPGSDPPWDPLNPDGPPVGLEVIEDRYGNIGENGPDAGVGSVDENGKLITVGPKKRAGVRFVQGILSLGAGISSLYGALFIKTPTPAPPASRPPAFALYGFSIITFGLVLYLFAIRPCCCGSRPKDVVSYGLLPGSMMANKRGYGDFNFTFINMSDLGQRQDVYRSENEPGWQGSMSRGPQRRSHPQGMMIERQWIAARMLLKRILIADALCLVIWTGVFIFILVGKRCPPGTFNGWCDSYNIATAAACLLSVAYGLSVYFGVVDLHMSKDSPRTQT